MPTLAQPTRPEDPCHDRGHPLGLLRLRRQPSRPRLADRLGVAFIDRAILIADVDDALAHDDAVRGWSACSSPCRGSRGAAGAARGRRHERPSTRRRGRDPRALCGGLGRHPRTRWCCAIGPCVMCASTGRPAAAGAGDGARGRRPGAERQALRETDRAREAYVNQFYGVDARDAALYHIAALALDACVELVALAAGARSARGDAARRGAGAPGPRGRGRPVEAARGARPPPRLRCRRPRRPPRGRPPHDRRGPPVRSGAAGVPDPSWNERPRVQSLPARAAAEPRRRRRAAGRRAR